MYLIIHNPLSRNRKGKRATKKLIKYLNKTNQDFMLRSSLKINDINDYLKNKSEDDKVLITGGDGTINYLINKFDFTAINHQIYLEKSGSGNDFLRTLKKKGMANTDIFEVSFNDQKKKFVNSCGMGVDSLVCHYVNKSKHKNKLSYFFNALKAIKNYKPSKLHLEVDGLEYDFNKALFITTQNGKYFGGGMKVAPRAELDDGKLSVIVCHNMSKAFVFFVFISIYLGLHTKLKKKVFMIEGSNIKATMENTVMLETDGEVYQDINTIEISKKDTLTITKFKK